MDSSVEKAKGFFYKMVTDFNSDPYTLIPHLLAVEKWANYLLKKYPEADSETALLGVWLHDIGHYPILNEDHAVTGEKIAREFLGSIGLDKDRIGKVAQCVRRHRCRDIQPETIEEKITAFSDSASNMTAPMYLNMLPREKRDSSPSTYDLADKIERDFRNLSFFPEIKKQMRPLYNEWKKLLVEYEKINEQLLLNN